MSGAGWVRTMARIVLPQTRLGVAAAWVITFVLAFRLGVSIVAPPGRSTLPIRITIIANTPSSTVAGLALFAGARDIRTSRSSRRSWLPSGGAVTPENSFRSETSQNDSVHTRHSPACLSTLPPAKSSLCGPSGCGKTTLLRLIAGLDVPDTGEIWLSGSLVAAAGRSIVPPYKKGDRARISGFGALAASDGARQSRVRVEAGAFPAPNDPRGRGKR